MKQTMWTELLANDCIVLDVQRGEYTGNLAAVRIAHPSLRRARWFIPSQKGNLYSRYTGKESNPYAVGYIIKGELSL